MKRYVIAGDFHIPFHNSKAYKLFLQITTSIYESKQLEGIILNGDISDFYFCNQHGKDPALGAHLKDERRESQKILKDISTRFLSVDKTFITGNHCTRLMRFFQSKAPDLYGIMDLNEFLGLELFGYKEVPHTPDQAYQIPGTDIVVRHEGISNGVNATRATVQKAVSSVIFSHTHRIALSNINTLGGRELTGINIGCLCDFKNPQAPFQYVKGHHQWQLGFAVVTVLDNGTWFYDIVHIREKGKKLYCKFDSNVYFQG